MNSWKSTLLSECTPPLSTFIIGTGSTWASTPADVAVERSPGVRGGDTCHGERSGDDGVGAEAGLVRGAVEIDECQVDAPLVVGLGAEQGVGDLAVHVRDGLAHPSPP